LEHVAHNWVRLELPDLFLGLGQINGGLEIIEALLVNWESIAHAVIEG